MSRVDRGLVEIWMGGEPHVCEKQELTRLRFLNESDFMELLQHRLGKSAEQIKELLKSYQPSVSTF